MSRNKWKMLTTVVSDTDWGISAPFGNMIQAIWEKKSINHEDKIHEIYYFGRTDG